MKTLWKRVTKYGDSLCIAMTRELKEAGYEPGDYVQIIIAEKEEKE